jgi:outer membrane protein TolC
MIVTMPNIKRLKCILPKLGIQWVLLTTACFSQTSVSFADSTTQPLTLAQSQALAVSQDPWQRSNALQHQALLLSSEAAGQLPDPMLTLGLANMPIDTWRVNQEPMTQMVVGINQQFARGDSLAIRQQQLREQAASLPWLSQERQARVRADVSYAWLDAFTAQQRLVQLDEHYRALGQLSEVVAASYASAQGSSQQQDLISIDVALARLDDRKFILQQNKDTAFARLLEWLPREAIVQGLGLPQTWPQFPALRPELQNALINHDMAVLREALRQHPSLLAIGQHIKAQEQAVALSEEKYKPQWGLSANYGYRDSDPMGQSRSDFFSIMLNVDLPLFTTNKQDKDREAAVLTQASLQTDQELMLRRLVAKAMNHWHSAQQLQQRMHNYQQQLLPKLAAQAQANLNAYTAATGNFSEVLRSQIEQLDTQEALLSLHSALLKEQAELQYVFITKTENELNRIMHTGAQP